MIGQAGVTEPVLAELKRLLAAHELVKIRFTGADRHERASLAEQIATSTPCLHVGSVGATALFFLPNEDESKRRIELPASAPQPQ